MEMILKIQRGCLLIPKIFQEKYNLQENDEILIMEEADHLILKKKMVHTPEILSNFPPKKNTSQNFLPKIKRISDQVLNDTQKKIETIKQKEETFRDKELYSFESYSGKQC